MLRTVTSLTFGPDFAPAAAGRVADSRQPPPAICKNAREEGRSLAMCSAIRLLPRRRELPDRDRQTVT